MPNPAETLDFYRIIRSRIEHEDNLVTQRLSWLIASQSFFFTAFAVVNGEAKSAVQQQLIRLIPIVAALIAALIFCSIIAGVLAKAALRAFYRQSMQSPDGKPIYLTASPAFPIPLIQGRRLTILLGLLPPLGLPPLFIVVWVLLYFAAR